jgi:hypothetical protein
MHPGEYGRVGAWIKKTKNDLVLNKDIYGHPPSIVFERQATQYMKARAIDPDTIPGYPPQGDNHSYIVAPNGTPQLRRHHGVSNTYCRGIESVYRTKERAV